MGMDPSINQIDPVHPDLRPIRQMLGQAGVQLFQRPQSTPYAGTTVHDQLYGSDPAAASYGNASNVMNPLLLLMAMAQRFKGPGAPVSAPGGTVPAGPGGANVIPPVTPNGGGNAGSNTGSTNTGGGGGSAPPVVPAPSATLDPVRPSSGVGLPADAIGYVPPVQDNGGISPDQAAIIRAAGGHVGPQTLYQDGLWREGGHDPATLFAIVDALAWGNDTAGIGTLANQGADPTAPAVTANTNFVPPSTSVVTPSPAIVSPSRTMNSINSEVTPKGIARGSKIEL